MKKYIILLIFNFTSLRCNIVDNIFKDIKHCKNHFKEEIPELKRQKISLDVTNSKLRTPLIVAAIHGCDSILKKLIDLGADIYKKDIRGLNALAHAYKKFKKAKSLNKRKKYKKIISVLENQELGLELISAAQNGNLSKVIDLIDKKANINFQNNFKETPLIKAVNSGNRDLVEFLVKNGAGIEIEDSLGNNALDHAILLSKENDNSNYKDILNILKENKFESKDKQLLNFVKSGNLKEVVNLLNNGANPNLSYYDNHNLLMLAVKNKDINIVTALVLNGADPKIKDDHGLNALDYATSLLEKEKDYKSRRIYENIIDFLTGYI